MKTLSEQIEELKLFRDIGEKFNYLGIEMIVTGHVRMTVAGQGTFPILSANYVSNDGIVQNIEFTIDRLPVLIAENTQQFNTPNDNEPLYKPIQTVSCWW